MQSTPFEQNAPTQGEPLRIGVDVGGTFTDLVAFDGNSLRVVKIPSTPPDFHKAVIEAVRQAVSGAPASAQARTVGDELKPVAQGAASDEDLMRRAQQGDKQAFVLLYERYYKAVESYLNRMLTGIKDLESIVQEAFLRTYRFAPAYRYPQKFSTWLFTITRNLAINESRHRRQSPIRNFTDLNLDRLDISGEPQQAAARATDDLEEQQEIARVLEALEQLPGNQKEVILLNVDSPPPHIVHGSTVATNALLQRAGERVAFVTTEGFRDMLLIGRQNRPNLYALQIVRPTPLTPAENWFTVRERMGASGDVVEALEQAEIDRLIKTIQGRGLRHVAVCLLFSFVNPAHEQAIGRACRQAGLTVSLSSEVLPEFREYERASTTVINASLRPTVEAYLRSLVGDGGFRTTSEREKNPESATPIADLRIMHSGGGTLSVEEAGASAARLVLSGPAGGVMGAAFVAKAAGIANVITYDMGGTSTDVAVILDGQPQWTTASQVDGLPLGLPAFDIITVGAGGGSIAWLDAGGALRVGPRSAGAVPGPACYGRGGAEPTVTDANLLLGRIMPDRFAGGSMRVEPDLARGAIDPLARSLGKSAAETALGIVRVAEQNMSRAIRAVTSRRGLDPRDFALVSFGGAGGLHACALAESLDIPRVLVPPYCGVLSALGMVAAPAVADVSKTIVHLSGQLDDNRLYAEFGSLNGIASDQLPAAQTAAVEAYADARFKGQSYEVKIRVTRPDRELIEAAFREEYRKLYGQVPEGRAVEIVTLRIRRVGHVPRLELPEIPAGAGAAGPQSRTHLLDAGGVDRDVPVLDRGGLVGRTEPGPFLIIDPEATTYVMPGWTARGMSNGSIVLETK